MYNTKDQIAKAVEATNNALLVYQDENGQYQIAAVATDAGAVMEMAALVGARLDIAAASLLNGGL